MATNDGYAPYPLGLTAAEAVQAITRAANLSTELDDYTKCFRTESAPTVDEVNEGDFWIQTSTTRLYRAHTDGSTLFWFEV